MITALLVIAFVAVIFGLVWFVSSQVIFEEEEHGPVDMSNSNHPLSPLNPNSPLNPSNEIDSGIF